MEMELYSLIELCCSLFAGMLSYWSMVSVSTSLWPLPMKQTWTIALESFTSKCWISYAIHHHPLSWFLIATSVSPLILHLLCFVTFIYYQFRGSQFRRGALHAIIALGTPPLVFIVVSLLWMFDVVSGICFAIFAVLAGISSSTLTVVRLWYDPKSGDWKIIVRSILGLVRGALALFIGIRQHSILFLINSVAVLIFGLVHLGVAFFAHENYKVPWFSHGISHPRSSESVGPSQS